MLVDSLLGQEGSTSAPGLGLECCPGRLWLWQLPQISEFVKRMRTPCAVNRWKHWSCFPVTQHLFALACAANKVEAHSCFQEVLVPLDRTACLLGLQYLQ